MSNRDKMFNRIAMAITIILAIIALWVVTASAAKLECEAGTYDAGGFCKVEPTGCPYGDSIPLDSPKCAPSEEPDSGLAENGTLDTLPVADNPVVTDTSWGK